MDCALPLATSMHLTEKWEVRHVLADRKGVEFWYVTDYIQGDQIAQSFAWFSSFLDMYPIITFHFLLLMQLSRQWLLSFRPNLAYLSHLERSSSLRPLFNILEATLPVEGRLLRPQNENAPCRGDRDSATCDLYMGPTGCPETSVINYQHLPCDFPEERRRQPHCGGSLKISQHDASCSCEVPLTSPIISG